MQIVSTTENPIVTVVGCLHGDETFGALVIRELQSRQHDHTGLRLIIANEEAIAAHSRFIDDDMNRSFPGSSSGNHEQQLAQKMLPHIADCKYLIDIHTTTSDIKMTPIVANLSDPVKRVINLTDSKQVALMTNGIADHALIGQVAAGVSLEFNEDYARTDEALEEAIAIIEALLAGKQAVPRTRQIFSVSGTIPRTEELPSNARNFQLVPKINVYPFLLSERGYTAHQGFAAKSFTTETI